MKYLVIDHQTGVVLSTHTTAAAARRKCDRLDLAYGAVRYDVKTAYPLTTEA
jgi:hypothetical protein